MDSPCSRVETTSVVFHQSFICLSCQVPSCFCSRQYLHPGLLAGIHEKIEIISTDKTVIELKPGIFHDQFL